MGVPPQGWERHIAWDIGAAALADALGEAWGCGVIKQRWSRLVIDCNREPSRADAIPEVSDGQVIPANVSLSSEARAARVAEVHAPYHAAIAAELEARTATGVGTLLVLVHSFTPRMAGVDRPWTLGVLHAGNSPTSLAALELLRREPGETVGDNEPYAMDLIDYTAPTHAVARGLDYLELEVRQDLIADAAGVARIAALLARVVPQAAA
jgi:predicted N-formylglutamate amidohydrolase